MIPAPAVTGAPPTAAELAALRARVDRHIARVHIGQDVYDIRGGRFGPDGVAFDPGRLRMSSPVFGDGRPPPSSPLAWDRIDRVTVRKPCGQRGAVVGGLIGTGAMIAIAAYWNAAYHGDLTAGAAVIFTLPPIGALLGSTIGANILRTEPGWKRAAAADVGAGIGAFAPHSKLAWERPASVPAAP